jgi:hypothetical protein
VFLGLVLVVLWLTASPFGKASRAGIEESPAAQSASPPVWTEAALAPDRWWAATTFATSTCEVIAYGGSAMNASGSPTLTRDTLIYQPDQNRWLSVVPQKSGGPPSLVHAGLTFDPYREVAVLFGGSSGKNDTYAFDPYTRKWTTLVAASSCSTASCPSPRRQHAQAWSTVKGAVLVFGGLESGYSNPVANDLWALLALPAKRGGLTWKWMRLQPDGDPTYGLPQARSRHGMAEIQGGPNGGAIVIYGGWDAHGNALFDTWLYDPGSNQYTFLPNAGTPTPRQGFAMGYAPPLEAVIIQGGQTNPGSGPQYFTQETWAFDPELLEWSQVPVGAPPGDRSYHDIASDTCRGTAIVFDKPATTSGRYPTWILK